MIPLTITVDEYAKCFVPAPEYLVLERLRVDFDTISRIAIPKSVSEGMRYQIGVGARAASGVIPLREMLHIPTGQLDDRTGMGAVARAGRRAGGGEQRQGDEDGCGLDAANRAEGVGDAYRPPQT